MKTPTPRIYRHKREIDKYINIVEDFNTILSIMDRSKVQKSVKIQEVNELHLTDIYRTLTKNLILISLQGHMEYLKKLIMC